MKERKKMDKTDKQQLIDRLQCGGYQRERAVGRVRKGIGGQICCEGRTWTSEGDPHAIYR